MQCFMNHFCCCSCCFADTRQRHDYSESHIITAKFAPRNDIGAFLVPYEAELQTKEHVVIYDSNTFSLKDKNSTALSCAKLMWDMGSKNPVKVIKGGYEDFSRLYPFLRTQKIIYMTRELDVNNTYPVEVIPGFLYLSTFQQSQDKKIIKDLKVKANVIVAKETDKIFAPESTTLGKDEKRVKQILNLPVDDSGKEDIYSQLTDVVNFIDDHDNKDGRTVLLTSTLGISRSVTVAIAYYMWNKKVSLKDAYNHLKKCRENMQPTRGFIEQLSSWEEKIFGSKVTDITEPEY